MNKYAEISESDNKRIKAIELLKEYIDYYYLPDGYYTIRLTYGYDKYDEETFYINDYSRPFDDSENLKHRVELLINLLENSQLNIIYIDTIYESSLGKRTYTTILDDSGIKYKDYTEHCDTYESSLELQWNNFKYSQCNLDGNFDEDIIL